jgi:chromosome partitioning protein
MDLLLNAGEGGAGEARADDVPGGKPARKLAKLLAPLAAEYDAVFLDCPPSVSLVSENVLHAADVIVVPLIPTTLSVRTLDQLSEFIGEFKSRKPEILAFFSMVDRRKKLHREITERLSAERAEVALTTIPALSVIETMSVERAPVAVFAPSSSAAKAYRSLWAELASRAG